MPGPTTRTGQAGTAVVYSAMTPSDSYARDARWSVSSVTLGSRSVLSSATIEFNRADYLRARAADQQVEEPIIYQDSRFIIAWHPPGGSASGYILFEGNPTNLTRIEAGAVGSAQSTGTITLVHAMNAWRAAPIMQITGSHYGRIANGESGGAVWLDTTMPCVFNPSGVPNRSVQTATDSGIFSPADSAPVHHFIFPGGYDYGADGPKRARFWTFAQAIGYLLWYWALARSSSAVTNYGYNILWGSAPGAAGDGSHNDYLWNVVKGDGTPDRIHIEATGENYDGQTPPPPQIGALDVSPAKLLTAKIPGISVQGLDIYTAVVNLCKAAGLGVWIDSVGDIANIDSPPDQIEHAVKVWSPGGELQDGTGIGSIYTPVLEPIYRSIKNRSIANIIAANNVQSISVNWDYTGQATSPQIQRSATLYEITADLRPLWRPLTSPLDGSGTAWFDDCSNENVTDPDMSGNATMQQAASADAELAFRVWRGKIDIMLAGNMPTNAIRRADFLARSLHANGDRGQANYDIGRKWGLPADMRYPDSLYARADSPGTISNPVQWRSYTPVDFSDASADAPLLFPIQGAEKWPHRARRFLPCLVTGAGGQSPGVIVEISFDSGDTWHLAPSFRVANDELAIWLTYASPFDIVNPDTDAITANDNLFVAYINHTFRVRVTATIEGSDQTVSDELIFDTVQNASSIIYDRKNRYGKTELLSKHIGRTATSADQLADPADPDAMSDPNSLIYLYVPQDDDHAMALESQRIQAFSGDPKISGGVVIPWIETSVRPGSVVPYIAEPKDKIGEVPRDLDFRTLLDGGVTLAPHIVGVLYSFGTGNFSTNLQLEDWRSVGLGAVI